MLKNFFSVFFNKKIPLNQMQHICISRTDAIGDVILTLPLAGIIKKSHPHIRISFLCSEYTCDVVRCSGYVDDIVTVNKMSSFYSVYSPDMILHIFPSVETARFFYQKKVPYRIGTWGRLHHWLYCNYLVPFSRKNSSLHEAELNTKLLKVTDAIIPDFKSFSSFYGFHLPEDYRIPEDIQKDLDGSPYIILHPRSGGSAREWDEKKFVELAYELHRKGYKVVIGGTGKEKTTLKELPYLPFVYDAMGKLALKQYIALITRSAGLVAASTGPLHIAAMSGVKAAGLFPSLRPIHAGRWAPLGINAKAFRYDETDRCRRCAKSQYCECINRIPVEKILLFLTS